MSVARNEREIDILKADIEDYITETVADPSPQERSRALCRWCMDALFGIPESAADKYITDGTGDNSMDAVLDYYDSLVIIQAKCEGAHSYKEMHNFILEADRIKRREFVHPRGDMHKVISRITHWNGPLRFVYLTNAKISQADRDRTAHARSTSDVEFLDLEGIVTYLENRRSSLPTEVEGRKFGLAASADSAVFRYGNALVAAVPLSEVARMVDEFQLALFAQDIRGLLKSKVNRNMRDTLKAHPARFFSYNNGITIVCKHVEWVKGSGLITLTGPQVVNGCQTAYTIHNVVKIKPQVGQEGMVLLRILEESDTNELRNITIYTNSQNAVRRSDFLALEDRIRALQQRAATYGVYVETQKGAFALLESADRLRYQGRPWMRYLLPDRKNGIHFAASTLVRAYTSAFLDDPVRAFGSSQDLMPDGAGSWDKLEHKHERAGLEEIEHFLLPTLALQYAESVLGYGVKDSDPMFMRSGRWLYIYTYFRLLWHWFAQSGIAPSHNPSPRDIPTRSLKVLFKQAELNQQLLRLAHSVLEDYFKDGMIMLKVGRDYNWFFKSGFKLLEDKSKHQLLYGSVELMDAKIRMHLESASKKGGLPSFKVTSDAAASQQA